MSKTFVTIGMSGRRDDEISKVVYGGPIEEKAFSFQTDEVYDYYSVEVWIDEEKVQEFEYGENGWNKSFDISEELLASIQYHQESLAKSQEKLSRYQELL